MRHTRLAAVLGVLLALPGFAFDLTSPSTRFGGNTVTAMGRQHDTSHEVTSNGVTKVQMQYLYKEDWLVTDVDMSKAQGGITNLVAGNNIVIEETAPGTKKISAIGGGGGLGPDDVNLLIGLYDVSNITPRVNAKQNQLTAGSNITITVVGDQTVIAASGGGSSDIDWIGVTNVAGAVVTSTVPCWAREMVPTITNGFVKLTDLPQKVSDFTNDAEYVTRAVTNGLAAITYVDNVVTMKQDTLPYTVVTGAVALVVASHSSPVRALADPSVYTNYNIRVDYAKRAADATSADSASRLSGSGQAIYPDGTWVIGPSSTDTVAKVSQLTAMSNALDSTKADKAKDLFGYGITNAYTKTETDSAITGNVVDGTTSTSGTKALSANQGRLLKDEIDRLKGRGKYLSIWNARTGLAVTSPGADPYTYQSGDYFIVGIISPTNTILNYKPSGTTYTTNAPSTVVETNLVAVNDTYIFDGTIWTLMHSDQPTVTFGSIAGSPEDNDALKTALDGKRGLTDLDVYEGEDKTGDQLATTTGVHNIVSPMIVAATNGLYTAVTGHVAKVTKDFVTESVTNGILEAAVTYADDATNRSYQAAVTYADSATNEAVRTAADYTDAATNAAVSTAAAYTDDATNVAVQVTADYTDSATNATLTAAAAYTDAATNAAVQAATVYTDDATNATYASAVDYTDSATNATLQSTTDYTDEATNATYQAAVDYTDVSTNAAVQASADYTDSATNDLHETVTDYVDDATNAVVTYVGNELTNKQDVLIAGHGITITPGTNHTATIASQGDITGLDVTNIVQTFEKDIFIPTEDGWPNAGIWNWSMCITNDPDNCATLTWGRDGIGSLAWSGKAFLGGNKKLAVTIEPAFTNNHWQFTTSAVLPESMGGGTITLPAFTNLDIVVDVTLAPGMTVPVRFWAITRSPLVTKDDVSFQVFDAAPTRNEFETHVADASTRMGNIEKAAADHRNKDDDQTYIVEHTGDFEANSPEYKVVPVDPQPTFIPESADLGRFHWRVSLLTPDESAIIVDNQDFTSDPFPDDRAQAFPMFYGTDPNRYVFDAVRAGVIVPDGDRYAKYNETSMLINSLTDEVNKRRLKDDRAVWVPDHQPNWEWDEVDKEVLEVRGPVSFEETTPGVTNLVCPGFHIPTATEITYRSVFPCGPDAFDALAQATVGTETYSVHFFRRECYTDTGDLLATTGEVGQATAPLYEKIACITSALVVAEKEIDSRRTKEDMAVWRVDREETWNFDGYDPAVLDIDGTPYLAESTPGVTNLMCAAKYLPTGETVTLKSLIPCSPASYDVPMRTTTAGGQSVSAHFYRNPYYTDTGDKLATMTTVRTKPDLVVYEPANEVWTWTPSANAPAGWIGKVSRTAHKPVFVRSFMANESDRWVFPDIGGYTAASVGLGPNATTLVTHYSDGEKTFQVTVSRASATDVTLLETAHIATSEDTAVLRAFQTNLWNWVYVETYDLRDVLENHALVITNSIYPELKRLSPLPTNTYTKAETEQKIIELAPAPGNYAAVSNAAVSAHYDATNLVVAATNGLRRVDDLTVYENKGRRNYVIMTQPPVDTTGWSVKCLNWDAPPPFGPSEAGEYFIESYDGTVANFGDYSHLPDILSGGSINPYFGVTNVIAIRTEIVPSPDRIATTNGVNAVISDRLDADAVRIGQGAAAAEGTFSSAVAVGALSSTRAAEGISIGRSANVASVGAVAIGARAFASGTGAVSLGRDATSHGAGSFSVSSPVGSWYANGVPVVQALLDTGYIASNVTEVVTNDEAFSAGPHISAVEIVTNSYKVYYPDPNAPKPVLHGTETALDLQAALVDAATNTVADRECICTNLCTLLEPRLASTNVQFRAEVRKVVTDYLKTAIKVVQKSDGFHLVIETEEEPEP